MIYSYDCQKPGIPSVAAFDAAALKDIDFNERVGLTAGFKLPGGVRVGCRAGATCLAVNTYGGTARRSCS